MNGNITKLSGSFLMTQVSMQRMPGNRADLANQTSFSSFLKSDSQQSPSENKAEIKSENNDSLKYQNDRPQVKDNSKKSENITNDDKLNETSGKNSKEVKELSEDAAKEVVKEIKDVTDASDEDIAKAMEVLGLAMIDLLQPENVSALFENLEQISDPSELLTNEEMANDLSVLLDEVSKVNDELLDKLGMDNEEFKEAISNIANDNQLLDGIAKQNDEEVVDGLGTAKDEDAKTDNGPVVLVKDLRDSKEETKTESLDTSALNENAKAERTVKKSDDKESFSQQHGFGGTAQGNTEFIDDVDNTASVNGYINSQTEEIVKQIVSQIKITITQSASAMQMELHPESLGHVALSIESKGGVITAQFTAQNEVVKEAIESQIAELRESIEAQGVKVEAVEVTVASHEFEQNLQQNNRNDAQDEKKDSNVSKAGRRIRLNLNEELDDEELSEEERIAKELMEENGNSVDYTA